MRRFDPSRPSQFFKGFMLLKTHGPFGLKPEIVSSLASPTPPPHRQYILRMPVRHPNTSLLIPKRLAWLREQIEAVDDLHYPYYYVTVRHGLVTSVTDDVWHLDGYSARVKHEPEVDYLWSNCFPTEFMLGNFIPPKAFDPMKHNIHLWLQDHAKGEIFQASPNTWYKISPYVVHRRPQVPIGIWRTMVRLSLVPIEIEDPNATSNPLLPVFYPERTDIRETLTRFKGGKL